MPEKRNPVQVLIENKKHVLDAYRTGGGPKKAWGILAVEVPEIAESMSFNSFKVYVVPFVMIATEYEKQLEAVTQELHKASERKKELQARLEAVMQELENTKGKVRETDRKESDGIVTQELHSSDETNISGWTVHKGKDGYFRLHRRFKGRLYSIYAGKTLDRDKALKKIRAKESELGIRED